MWLELLQQIRQGDIKALARGISYVENGQAGYEEMLQNLPQVSASNIIGVTGPPGAGKSTLVDGLIGELIRAGRKIGVLCVDPSSPFNRGAVLGDRIRMSQWYINPNVYIRSLATRGALGGLHPSIIEIADLVKAAGFDFIIIETVGVGQSEVEIAALADATVVVVVPEAGDEVQTMKAGLMEIADIFVVNKSDRPGADAFIKNLRMMLAPAFNNHQLPVPIIKTSATEQQGIGELMGAILEQLDRTATSDRRTWLLTERAWRLIENARMQTLSKAAIAKEINEADPAGFNLYRFAKRFYLNH